MWIERDKEIKCCNKTVISLEDPTHADTVCRVSTDLVHIRNCKRDLDKLNKIILWRLSHKYALKKVQKY